jgi:hypothetical protein
VAVLSACGFAQSSDATLSGVVSDPGGAVIAGASVTAASAVTGLKKQVTANESGVYVFAALPPGAYTVQATAPGFRQLNYTGVTLEVGARLQLNLKLEVGTVSESIEVKAESENLLGYATASVGGMLTGQKVLDLPLPSRDALGLVLTQAGVLGDNFSGNRTAALNITLDGVNVQDQRNHQGLSTPVFTSVDRIEALRVVTAPADAELGRGSGQVQMLTRSGTNEFHGSLFWFHRNTVLNANTFFNNARGTDPRTGDPISPRNNLIRNQFGGRIGGPIVRNKTFFHFLYDAQRIAARSAITSTVLTAPARQGLFRYFPGVRNGNAESLTPVVDLQGNPLRPAQASGPLETASVFNQDPARMGPDSTGVVRRMLEVMPLPNNFRVGDGLNTAGYTWQRSSTDDFDVYNIKIDHNFNSSHRLSYTYNLEDEFEYNTRYEQTYPASPGGEIKRRDHFHTVSLLSTLSSRITNEFRAGFLRPDYLGLAPWQLEEFQDFLPRVNGRAYLPVAVSFSDIIVTDDNPVRLFSPLQQYVNNVSWTQGKHIFKAGVDVRLSSTDSFNSTDVMPRVNLGTGGVAVQNIERLPGIGQNLTAARNLLLDLSGSVNSVVQAFNATGGSNPQYEENLFKYRHWRRPEVSWFFKDDWKIHPRLTLNLGVRWEFYGVPADTDGRTASLEGGTAGIFGLSGSSYADVYQPGRLNGSLTRVNLIGAGTANPDTRLYRDDFNNFAPAIGFSWQVPWFKKATVIRAGYGIAYERQSLRLIDVVSGDQPGLRERVVFQSGNYLNLGNVSLPLATTGPPLTTIPVTDRAQTVRVFDQNLRTPYIQNWNFSIQRELARDMVFEVRYVGSKATKLIRGADINERNMFENGLLDAFLAAQQGGQSALLDRLFMGINVAGLGVVNGTSIRGADAARTISVTQTALSQNNPATFVEYFNTNTAFSGVRGGLLRRAGLPENFVIANPQFSSARLASNVANSNYHSLQLELNKRFSGGWTFQGNYTFSKALGEEDGDGDELNRSYRSGRDRTLDKKRLGFDFRHVVRTSGTYELPFGPGKLFLTGSRGFVARLVERWQVGSIVNIFSGQPMTIFSGRASFNTFNSASTPATNLVTVNNDFGSVVRRGNGVWYFEGLQQVRDPAINGLTTLNNIRSSSTLQAVADAQGNLVFVNAAPGSPGTSGLNFFDGPRSVRFDINVVKRVRLTERFTMELRADAISALNKPNFALPERDINSTNFGRITATDGGNRIMVVSARINF